SLRELAEGRWQPVIDDARVAEVRGEERRLAPPSGKFFVDLATSAQAENCRVDALVRAEQLYPFPAEEIADVLGRYPNLEEVVWAQEEPENMGAWEFVRARLYELIDGRWPLRYIGRTRNASPAEGSASQHAANQAALVEAVFAGLSAQG